MISGHVPILPALLLSPVLRLVSVNSSRTPQLRASTKLQQTLYIYLGVAALIGLFTGSFLHFSSRILAEVLNLHTSHDESGRAVYSIRAGERKRSKDIWKASAPIRVGRVRKKTEETSKDYPEYIEKDRGKRKDEQGLLSQTILEDSEDGF